jgi:hypothetical protein
MFAGTLWNDEGTLVQSSAMFRAKPVLTPEKAQWLESSFDFLGSLFGEDWVVNAPLVLPNAEFFPREYEATEEWGTYAFDRVRELMRVPEDGLFLEFTPDPADELRDAGVQLTGRTSGALGLHQSLQSDEGAGAHITILKSLLKEPEKMVATMSHELAHVLLLGGGKITRDHPRMEPLTDLMTVFSGFGIFTANAAFEYRSGMRGWRVSRAGYLTEQEFGYALALFALRRAETKPKWSRELKKNVRVAMESTLRRSSA